MGEVQRALLVPSALTGGASLSGAFVVAKLAGIVTAPVIMPVPFTLTMRFGPGCRAARLMLPLGG